MHSPRRPWPPKTIRWIYRLALLLIFGAGAGVTLVHGRVGFMPLDQSIVFDGAWRLLCGQVPFRDFTTPSGLTPIAMQACFFRLLGVTWFSYCLHAALLNGCFCLLSAGFARECGAGRLVALAAACLGGVVFYVPFGTPYPEQHAFFFTLAALWLVLLMLRKDSSAALLGLGVLTGLAFAAAFLGKPIPAIFGLPLFVFLLASCAHWKRVALALCVGFGITLALLVLLGWSLSVDLELLVTYGWRLPGDLGQRRLFRLWSEPGALREALGNVQSHWNLLSFYVVQVLLVLSLLAALPGARRRASLLGIGVAAWLVLVAFVPGFVLHRFPSLELTTLVPVLWMTVFLCSLLLALLMGRALRSERTAIQEAPSALWAVFLAEALIAICYCFSVLTLNQPENGMPYLFLASLLCLPALRNLCVRFAKPSWSKPLVGAVLVLASFDAASFHARVNLPRSVHDGIQLEPLGAAGETHVGALDFLRWRTAPALPYTASNLADLTRELLAKPGNVFVMSDCSMLYALSGRPSLNPALWFHSGLSIPPRRDPARPAFDARLEQALSEPPVRWIVLEEAGTLGGLQASDFPGVQQRLESAIGRQAFGGLVLYELAPE